MRSQTEASGAQGGPSPQGSHPQGSPTEGSPLGGGTAQPSAVGRVLPGEASAVLPGGASAGPSPGLSAGAKGLAHRRLSPLRLVVEVLVLGGAALFVLRRAGRLGAVADAFDRLHWHWLVLAAGAEAGSITALSWLQARILREGGLQVRTRDLVPVTMSSNAVAQSLPAGTLFAEGYAFRQYQLLGASKVLGIWTELSAGALASAGLAAVALAGTLVVGPGLELKLLPAMAFILAGALAAAQLFRYTRWLSRLIVALSRPLGWALPKGVRAHLSAAIEATREMESFRPPGRVWALCLLAAAVNWSLDAVVLVVGLLAVGTAVPWRGVLLCYAAAQVLVELPVTPGGLGLVEGGLVELLIRFHVPASAATAATLVYRAVSYWLLVLSGWGAALWLNVHRRRAAARARAAVVTT